MKLILGIDEVGRGPWAGPLVVGAVVWPDGAKLEGLTDSKKLTAKKREFLNNDIKKLAVDYSLGEVSSSELDKMGLSAALKLATRRAVDGVKSDYGQIIIDGTINFLGGTKYQDKVSTLAKADLIVPAVSAASILAKVYRDNNMYEMAQLYPGYGFETNVGYGTAKHRQAIEKLGVTPIHRLSFAPLKKYRVKPTRIKGGDVTTKQLGDKAERIVQDFLIKKGHTVIARNFKTRWCEIDIVSIKNKTLFFTEVKYRSSDDFGGALMAVDVKKQMQMKYAVDIFMNSGRIKANNLDDYSRNLAVGLVSQDFQLDDWFVI